MEFSNQVIDITSRSFEDFHKAMSFFFRRSHEKVKAYAIDPKKGMIFYWYIEDSGGKLGKTSGGAPIQMLPYEMDYEATVQFAWHWLQETPLRGSEPDHDGDNKPGFRVYNERWTHVDEDHSALLGIQPIWAMYRKIIRFYPVMIRIILFRMDPDGQWTEGVPHAFMEGNAVIETLATGDLQLVPVNPQHLKFKILTKDWVEMQMKAQQQAMAQKQGGPVRRFEDQR